MNLENLGIYDLVVLWGAGKDIEWFDNQFKVDFVVDKDERKINKVIKNLKIFPVSYLKEVADKKILIVISSTKYSDSIKKEICSLNLKNVQVTELYVMRELYGNDNISHTLWGIDILIKDILIRTHQCPKDYSYIEIGACHPIAGSKSYILYKLGARGFLVEPNPDMKVLLDKYRHEDTIITAGIASEEGELQYYCFDFEWRNTFSKEHAEKDCKAGEKLKKVIDLPVITLDRLIEDNNIKTINTILFIQTMGSEHEIVENFDFDKYEFPIIVVHSIKESFLDQICLNRYCVIARLPKHAVLVKKEIYSKIIY